MEGLKWYGCKRDMGITVALTFFAFITWPSILTGWVDYWPLTLLYTIFLVFVATLLFCRRHFWTWTAISTYTITFGCIINLDVVLHPSQLLVAGIAKILIEVLDNALLPFVLFSPIAGFIYYHRKRPESRVSPYLLLWPIGWCMGVGFNANLFYSPGREWADYLAILSLGVFLVAAYCYDRTMDRKRHAILKWLSVTSWLPAGIIPGMISIGWKDPLFKLILPLIATILPCVTIYHYFELSKGESTKHNEQPKLDP